MSVELYSENNAENASIYSSSTAGMLEMLEHGQFFLKFQEFLEREYCPEPLLFWKCLKSYKNLFKEQKEVELKSPTM
jgi:hypothetical protein